MAIFEANKNSYYQKLMQVRMNNKLLDWLLFFRLFLVSSSKILTLTKSSTMFFAVALVGRILIPLYLVSQNLLSKPLLYMSALQCFLPWH
jgi:Fic family protein